MFKPCSNPSSVFVPLQIDMAAHFSNLLLFLMSVAFPNFLSRACQKHDGRLEKLHTTFNNFITATPLRISRWSCRGRLLGTPAHNHMAKYDLEPLLVRCTDVGAQVAHEVRLKLFPAKCLTPRTLWVAPLLPHRRLRDYTPFLQVKHWLSETCAN